ncbi:MAG: OmpH family outer membrane protein [Chitinophagales bacterium]
MIKSISKTLLLTFALLTLSLSLSAQGTNVKMGHVNFQTLLADLPSYAAAEKQLQKFAQELQTYLGNLNSEYESKVKQYYEEEADMLPSIKETRQKEIVDLEQRIQKLQGSSEQQLMEKQNELLAPLEEQIMTAVNEVAAEKGYAYVFDSSPGQSIIVAPESDNITPLVRAKIN